MGVGVGTGVRRRAKAELSFFLKWDDLSRSASETRAVFLVRVLARCVKNPVKAVRTGGLALSATDPRP